MPADNAEKGGEGKLSEELSEEPGGMPKFDSLQMIIIYCQASYDY